MAKIGLDTTGVEKSVRSLSRELREVDRALKDNADNAVLNAQKQEIISEEIGKLTEKLEKLRSAEEKVNQARANGQINDEEYRAYRREIENTEKAIGDLNKKLEENGEAGNEAAEGMGNWQDVMKGILGSKVVEMVADAAVQAAQKITDVVKEASAAYGEYEQLVGGVQTLFTGAEDIVAANAANAFSTAGVSANQYMKQITSFAASLVTSLEGDTAAAAKLADQALIDMSDNANKMGTDLQSIQNAYQGFAKQNYTMLDNLKLGYGGTKTEMERLIDDVNKWREANGEAGDLTISKFSDVVTAIHEVQEQLHISGTTADEAATTIQGSAGAAQAAWENLLVGLADPMADLDKLIDDFVNSKMVELDRLLPTVEHSVEGITSLIEQLIPKLTESSGLMDKLIDDVGEKAPELVIRLGENIVKSLPKLANAALTIAEKLITGISEQMPELVPTLVRVIGDTLAEIVSHAGEIVQAAFALIKGLSQGLVRAIPELLATVPDVIQALISELLKVVEEYSTEFFEVGLLASTELVKGMLEYDWEESGRRAYRRFHEGYKDAVEKENDEYVEEYVTITSGNSEKTAEELQKDLDENEKKLAQLKNQLATLQSLWAAAEETGNTDSPTSAYNKYFQKIGMDEDELQRQINSLSNLINEEKKLYDTLDVTVDEGETKVKKTMDWHAQEAARLRQNNIDSIGKESETLDRIRKEAITRSLARMENQWDSRYHYDKENYDEYWEEKRQWLKEHEADTKEWWEAWNEVEKHYSSEAANKQKEQLQAEKDRIDSAKKEYESALLNNKYKMSTIEGYTDKDRLRDDAAALERLKQKLGANSDDYKNAVINHNEDIAKVNSDADKKRKEQDKERNEQLKKQIEEEWDALEKQAKEANKTPEELIALKKETLNKLADGNKEIYDEFYKKIEKAENDEAEKHRAEEEKQQKEILDAAEKAAEKLVEAYRKRYSALMGAVDSPQQVTDKSGNKRLVFGDYRKKLAELKEYQNNIGKLKDLNLSSHHLNEIFSMDFETRALYIKELLSMGAENREKYLRDYEAYSQTAEDVSKQELDFDTQLTEDINKIFDEVDGYKSGSQTAAEWLQGFHDGLKGTPLEDYELENIIEPDVTAAAYGGTGRSKTTPEKKQMTELQGVEKALGKTPIIINIDNRKAVETTISEAQKRTYNTSALGVL